MTKAKIKHPHGVLLVNKDFCIAVRNGGRAPTGTLSQGTTTLATVTAIKKPRGGRDCPWWLIFRNVRDGTYRLNVENHGGSGSLRSVVVKVLNTGPTAQGQSQAAEPQKTWGISYPGPDSTYCGADMTPTGDYSAEPVAVTLTGDTVGGVAPDTEVHTDAGFWCVSFVGLPDDDYLLILTENGVETDRRRFRIDASFCE